MKINSVTYLGLFKGWLLLPILVAASHQAEAKTYHEKVFFNIYFGVHVEDSIVFAAPIKDQVRGYSEGSARKRFVITRHQEKRLRVQARQNAKDELLDTLEDYIASQLYNGGEWGGYDLSDTNVTLFYQAYNDLQPLKLKQELPGTDTADGWLNEVGMYRCRGEDKDGLPISLWAYVEFDDGTYYSTEVLTRFCLNGELDL